MLTILNLVKTFGATRSEKHRRVHAVDDLSFEVEEGELFTLLGPSGCGKTTTLRCVAGLEMPDRGEISVADRVLFSSERGTKVPANERWSGMVFQSYAIWPHMNVYKNVAFPLQVRPRNRRPSKQELRERVERALTVVQLDHLASRQATDLSGGQQQRLALARALVMEPPLMLLDEPLSNLDAKLRERMRFELKRLQRDLGITTVYVTHDQSEALALSHSVAVMNGGRIQQTGAPREIYERPGNQFVADFIGTTNFLRGTVSASAPGDGFCRVSSEVGELEVRALEALAPGTRVVISVGAEDIQLSEARPQPTTNVLEGRVDTKVFLGESVDFRVKVKERLLQSRAHPSLGTRVGHPIYLCLDPDKCVALKETPE